MQTEMETNNKVTCSWNGCELSEEETESPRLDPRGEVICDECYHEHFEFTCCCCENDEDDPDEAIRDAALVILDSEQCKLPRGFYQVIKWPIFTSDYFSMWFHEDALRFVGPVGDSEWTETWDGYPSGQLCRACQIKNGVPPGYRLYDPIHLGC